jgi:uncharacterized membrane protein
MPPLDHDLLRYLVRLVHLGAMAAVLGGSLLLVTLTRADAETDESDAARTLLRPAERYEWLFWAAAGLLVATGIGNLGAFGAGLPDPATTWGRRLTIKLLAVIALLLLSGVRTSLVIRLTIAPNMALAPFGLVVLRRIYAATALLLLLVFALGTSLAHG